MNTAKRSATLFEVHLDDGSTWTGTEAELRRDHPGWVKYARVVQPTRATRAAVWTDIEQDFADDPRPGRLPNSSRTYAPVPGRKQVEYEYQEEIVHTSIPPRRSAQRTPHPNYNRAQPPEVIYGQPARQRHTEEPRPRRRGVFRSHPLLWSGIGMALALLAWYGLSNLAAWWQVHQDDATYGRPRTAQYDVVVGHNDGPNHPTHIIALNLDRTVVIIELPGGDTSKSRIYRGPTLFGPDADLAPVTLTFPDPDHTGRPEMIVHVQSASIMYQNVRINGTWQFAPPQSQ